MGEAKRMDADRLAQFKEWARCHEAVHPGELLGEIAALEQHISDLEKSLENARKERDAVLADRDKHAQTAEVWRKRVHEAAEALADVLPGEVGRLNLTARIAALRGERDTWRQCAEERQRAAEQQMADKHALGAELASLAAKAQGYEAAILAWDDAARVDDWIARKSGPLSEAERRYAMRPPSPGERLLQKYWEMYGKIEKERDAAVADNADLVTRLSAEYMQWSGDQSWCRWCRTTTKQTMRAPRAPHDHAPLCPLARPRPGAALLDRHRKVLVRARNEGLEKASLALLGECDQSGAPDCECDPCMFARDIRAMKEPEQ